MTIPEPREAHRGWTSQQTPQRGVSDAFSPPGAAQTERPEAPRAGPAELRARAQRIALPPDADERGSGVLLHYSQPESLPASPGIAPDGPSAWEDIILFLRRAWPIAAVASLAAMLLALAYLSKPSFTATARLILDTRDSLLQGSNTVGGDAAADSARVESQVEVLQSDNVARRAAAALGLAAPVEPAAPAPARGTADGNSEPAPGTPDEAAIARAVETLKGRLRIRRVGLSYIVDISATAADPAMAARIANAVVEAYFAETIASRHQAAERAREWLETQVEDLRGRIAETDRTLEELRRQASDLSNAWRLRELEAGRATYQSMYEVLLRRYGEAVQLQTSPSTDARIVSAAAPPLQKSWLKGTIVLAGALIFGVTGGLVAAFLRERIDRSIRTDAQIEALLGARCLAICPLVPAVPRSRKGGPPLPSMLRMAQDKPGSPFTDAVRRLAVEPRCADGKAVVIGVISALPSEGKTTIATNLATLLGAMSRRTLLIDLNLHGPGSGPVLAPEAGAGIGDVLTGARSLQQAVIHDVFPGVDLLPRAASDEASAAEPLTSGSLRNLLSQARAAFDVILVDLEAGDSEPGSAALAPLADGFLVVVQWGATPGRLIAETLRANGIDQSLILGSVLNKVNTGRYVRYGGYLPGWYSRRRRHGFRGLLARLAPRRGSRR